MLSLYNDRTLEELEDFVRFLTKNQLCLNWKKEAYGYTFSIYCKTSWLSRNRYGVKIVEPVGWFEKKVLLQMEGILKGSASDDNLEPSVGILDFKPMLKKEIDMAFDVIAHDETFKALRQFLEKVSVLEKALSLGYHIELHRNNIYVKAKHYRYWKGGAEGTYYVAIIFKVKEGKRTIAEVYGNKHISRTLFFKKIKIVDDYLPLVSSIIDEVFKKAEAMSTMGLQKYVEDSP